MSPILKTGALAYIDTIASGLVPCKVIAVYGGHWPHVTVRVTATRYAYTRGETVTGMSPRIVVPRMAVYGLKRRNFHPRILPYTIENDSQSGATS